LDLIVNKVTKTNRKDKQEYLFGENSKFVYGNGLDPSNIETSFEGRLISFMVDDKYHVSIYAENDERFPNTK